MNGALIEKRCFDKIDDLIGMKPYCKNSYRDLAINYFRKASSIIDV